VILIAAILVVVLAGAWGIAIWRLVVPPAQQLVRIVTDLTPILIDLRSTFTGVDNPFDVLADILDQLHTESGLTLRDAIVRNERSLDRLETASDDAAGLAVEVKAELGRTQAAAANAGTAAARRADKAQSKRLAADAAAAATAAKGAQEPPE